MAVAVLHEGGRKRQYGLIPASVIAQCLIDHRAASAKVLHTSGRTKLGHDGSSLDKSRSCHPDGNDPGASPRWPDPIHKLLRGTPSIPISGRSRPESPRNRRSRGLKTSWGGKRSMPWGRSWRCVSAGGRHQRRRRSHMPGRIRSQRDLDSTDDATHGAAAAHLLQQVLRQLPCYQPLLAFLTFDDETEPYLCRPAVDSVLAGT